MRYHDYWLKVLLTAHLQVAWLLLEAAAHHRLLLKASLLLEATLLETLLLHSSTAEHPTLLLKAALHRVRAVLGEVAYLLPWVVLLRLADSRRQTLLFLFMSDSANKL